MKRRPILILDGKPILYKTLDIRLCAVGLGKYFEPHMPQAVIDWHYYDGVSVSQGTRPSGRQVICVDLAAPDKEEEQ